MNETPNNQEDFILNKESSPMDLKNSPDPKNIPKEDRNVSLDDNLKNKILEYRIVKGRKL